MDDFNNFYEVHKVATQTITDRAIGSFASNYPNSEFDPAFLMVIAEIIVQLITAIQEECGETPEAATKMANRPSFLQKRMLHLRTFKMLGLREYREHGANVVSAILHAGEGVTVEEMKSAYSEL